MTDPPDYRDIEIIEALPDVFHTPHGGEEFLRSLRNARIVRIGSPAQGGDIEGGGLVIDYICEGAADIRRVVFAFTELGLWIEWEGLLK